MTTFNAMFMKILTLLSGVAVAAGGEARAAVGPAVAADDVVSARATSTTLESPPLPLRYSLPWQLRPVVVETMVRIDTAAAAFNDARGNLDIAVPTVFAASHQVAPHWAPAIRLGVVGNNAPGAAFDGTSFANPSVGVTYARALASHRVALYGATTLPLGAGGGNAPNLRAAETNVAAMVARPADAAMFAVNHMAAIAGGDLAFVRHGLTVQAELTLLQFVRVRGKDGPGGNDAFRTQAAAGLHVGYFLGSHVSLSADVHYRRWLSRPTNASANPGTQVTFAEAGVDTTTVAFGPRFHFRLGAHGWVRPGLSFVRGLDARGLGAPLLTAQTTAVQLDIPVTF